MDDKTHFARINIVSVGLLLLCIFPLFQLVKNKFLFAVPDGFSIEFDGLFVFFIVLFAAVAQIMVIILHEAFHGLFFWYFSRAKVKYGFKGFYAYAACENHYFVRRSYIVVCLAPLVLLTALLALLLLLWPPVQAAGAFAFVVAMVVLNVCGSAGDVYIFYLLLKLSNDTYVRDVGDCMEIYAREPDLKEK